MCILPDHIDRALSQKSCAVLSAQIGGNYVICYNYGDAAFFRSFAAILDELLANAELSDVSIMAGTEQTAVGAFAQSWYEANRAIDSQILRELSPLPGWSYAEPLLDGDMHVSFTVSEEEKLIDLLKIGDGASASALAVSGLERNLVLPSQATRYLYHLLLVLPFRVLDRSVTSAGQECLAGPRPRRPSRR